MAVGLAKPVCPVWGYTIMQRYTMAVAIVVVAILAPVVAWGQRGGIRPKSAASMDPADVTALVGQVVEFEPDASITVEVRNRDEITKRKFAIVKEKTAIELPPRMREIKIGQTLAVWADREDSKLAAKIGSPNAAAPATMRRPGNRAATPGTPPGRSGNSARVSPSTTSVPLNPAQRREPGMTPMEVAAAIDREIEARLTTEKLPASGASDDAEFIRRVYLDITGVIPPADRVAAFLGSRDANKRAALMNE